MSGNRQTGIARGPIRSFWRRPARRGPASSVLELGCGVGVASLCLAARVEGLSLTGVERQADYAAWPRRNAERRAFRWRSWRPTSRACRPPAADVLRPRDRQPALFPRRCGTARRTRWQGSVLSRGHGLAFGSTVARARLKPRGWLTMIQHADRCPTCWRSLRGFGSVSFAPAIAGRARRAGSFCGRARAGGRRFSCLRPFLYMKARRICEDGESYTPEVQRGPARRGGAALARWRAIGRN
jgi:tRNA1Val (adenine37-N6)-methyltransferase